MGEQGISGRGWQRGFRFGFGAVDTLGKEG